MARPLSFDAVVLVRLDGAHGSILVLEAVRAPVGARSNVLANVFDLNTNLVLRGEGGGK